MEPISIITLGVALVNAALTSRLLYKAERKYDKTLVKSKDENDPYSPRYPKQEKDPMVAINKEAEKKKAQAAKDRAAHQQANNGARPFNPKQEKTELNYRKKQRNNATDTK